MLGRRKSFGWMRAIIAACLALLLSVAALTPLAAQIGGACVMKCCKAAKAACHRHDGSGWNAAPECPKGCGLSATLRTGSASVPAAVRIDGPRLQSSRSPFPSLSAWTGADTGFSLFERPPPSLT
jgi:hypothetical protein